jgi:hypothetical protein
MRCNQNKSKNECGYQKYHPNLHPSLLPGIHRYQDSTVAPIHRSLFLFCPDTLAAVQNIQNQPDGGRVFNWISG